MAVTLGPFDITYKHFGDPERAVRVVDVTFDSSYPTGGEPLTAATLGFSRVEWVSSDLAFDVTNTEARAVHYDIANEVLIALGDGAVAGAGTPLEEVANTTDLSTYIVRLQVVGVLA